MQYIFIQAFFLGEEVEETKECFAVQNVEIISLQYYVCHHFYFLSDCNSQKAKQGKSNAEQYTHMYCSFNLGVCRYEKCKHRHTYIQQFLLMDMGGGTIHQTTHPPPHPLTEIACKPMPVVYIAYWQ